jgi:phosphopantothenoylcysteine decarboxylase / phosphopantothenate---cysteine ligase
MHPSARLRSTKGRHLAGRRIVLAVSGSIAAVESVRLAHELIRHGAEVIPVMTKAATDMINPLALEYATGVPPILTLTGKGEHVALCGGGKGSADLLLVAPATANTIAKIALGIDDTALTSCATVALGAGVPIVIAPAMHEVMGHHPAVQQRLQELEMMGIPIVAPRIEEEKAKVASPETIVDVVIHRLASGPLQGKRVLVISGSTAEPLDPIRVVTNRSSGRMGVALATAAYRAGAKVDLWNAWGLVPMPPFAHVERFESVGQLLKMVDKRDLSKYDLILVPAALGDFAPKASKEKIPSDLGAVRLEMQAVPKVLPRIRKQAPNAFLVGFKAESDPKTLLARARQRMGEYRVDLMVANTKETFGSTDASVLVVAPRGTPRRLRGTKDEVAHGILEHCMPKGGRRTAG